MWEKNTNPITKKGELPEGFELTERDDQKIAPEHNDTTIVLFASLTRSFKYNTTYNKGPGVNTNESVTVLMVSCRPPPGHHQEHPATLLQDQV